MSNESETQPDHVIKEKVRTRIEADIDIQSDNKKKKPERLSVLYELYIDILGSLVPGLLIVILGGTTVVLALSSIHSLLYYEPLGAGFSFGGIKEIVASFHWEIATVILVSAYVLGAVFFRQDPKKPDARSALHVWLHAGAKDRAGLAVQPQIKLPDKFFIDTDVPTLWQKLCDWQKLVIRGFCTPLAELHRAELKSAAEAKQTSIPPKPILGQPRYLYRLLGFLFPESYTSLLKMDAQFPYLHLRCYLAFRGLTHLTNMVPWCPIKPETVSRRTKMFINIIKIRLLARCPEMSKGVIRNEAEVRLATSVWYAVRGLFALSFLVLIALVGTTWISSGLSRGSYTGFSASDVREPSTFWQRLTQQSNSVSLWLVAKISSDSHVVLTNNPAGLSTAIERILASDCIYEPGRFSSVVLRPETQELLAENPHGSSLKRLNRMLIEDAFPAEIYRRTTLPSSLFVSESFAGFILLLSAVMMHHLRKCIHYMRVREALYVLETAALAQMDNAEMFSDLKCGKTDFSCQTCDLIGRNATSN